MAGKSKRPKLVLTPEELERLLRLGQSPKAEARQALRAQILTRYQAGEAVAQIARNIGTTRTSVAKWINRALAIGPGAALKDAYHRPKAPVITEEACVWVVSLACIKPKDLGYAGLAPGELIELRSQGVTPGFVRELKDAGYDRLTTRELIDLRSHGVDPGLLKRLKGRGEGSR
jgi:hypothetical protein